MQIELANHSNTWQRLFLQENGIKDKIAIIFRNAVELSTRTAPSGLPKRDLEKVERRMVLRDLLNYSKRLEEIWCEISKLLCGPQGLQKPVTIRNSSANCFYSTDTKQKNSGIGRHNQQFVCKFKTAVRKTELDVTAL